MTVAERERRGADRAEFLLVVEGFGASTLVPVSFRVEEGISRFFEGSVEAVVPREAGPPEPHVLLGRRATLRLLHEEGERRFPGLLVGVRQVDDRRGFAVFELHLASPLWRLTRRVGSRFFQAMDVTEIARVLLEDVGLPAERVHVARSRERPLRDLCVQYDESEHDFLQRILHADGWFWYECPFDGVDFRPDADVRGLSVLIADDGMIHLPLPGGNELPFRPPRPLGGGETAVRSVSWSRALRGSFVRPIGPDFRAPEKPVDGGHLARVPIGDARTTAVAAERDLGELLHPAGFDAREVVGRPGEPVDVRAALGLDPADPRDHRPDELGHVAAARLHALRSDAVRVEGRSDVRRLRPGFRVRIVDHPDRTFDEDLLIVSVVHEGRQSPPDDPGFARERKASYDNAFVAVPASRPWRPPAPVPRPRVGGVHLGVVTGPPGEEIHVDRLGRIKVRFPWSQSPDDDRSSAWVRVMQSWAGNGWGSLVVPRVGQQVVVQFVDGDPDRPVVLGTLYDGAHAPPLTLPDHKTRTVFRTASTPGGRDHNEVRFEDRAGEEEIHVHAANALTVEVDGHARREVGGNDVLEVRRARRVQADRVEVSARRTLRLVAEEHVELVVGASSIRIEPEGVTLTSRAIRVVGEDEVVVRAPAVTVQEPTGEGGRAVVDADGVRVAGPEIRAAADARTGIEGPEVSIRSTTGSVTVEGTGGVDVAATAGKARLSGRAGTDVGSAGAVTTVTGLPVRLQG